MSSVCCRPVRRCAGGPCSVPAAVGTTVRGTFLVTKGKQSIHAVSSYVRLQHAKKFRPASLLYIFCNVEEDGQCTDWACAGQRVCSRDKTPTLMQTWAGCMVWTLNQATNKSSQGGRKPHARTACRPLMTFAGPSWAVWQPREDAQISDATDTPGGCVCVRTYGQAAGTAAKR